MNTELAGLQKQRTAVEASAAAGHEVERANQELQQELSTARADAHHMQGQLQNATAVADELRTQVDGLQSHQDGVRKLEADVQAQQQEVHRKLASAEAAGAQSGDIHAAPGHQET